VNVETLLRLPEARALFVPGRELVVTRAPGRLDVMGGIADYSGSLVLQLPLAVATLAALQRDPERRLRLVSVGRPAFEIALDVLEGMTYEQARAVLLTSWAAYAAGALLVLMKERGARFAEGARILIGSDVPAGKGVASSAALEVAVMTAVAAAFGVSLEPRETALLCQKAENLVVGAPCGVMDQMTAVCGEPNRLLALLCQPAELKPSVAIPDDLAVFGIDSGVSHAVSGTDYTSVRVAAFMGHRMLGLAATDYLANVSPAEFAQQERRLPELLRGREFLKNHGGIADSVTRVEAERDYAVRVCTAHPIHENARVHRFAELLAAPATEERRRRIGELMYQSHASYGACGLGSPATDRLVAMAREAGPAQGLYGAKITGGGSGGTVALLARGGADGETAVRRIAESYAREAGCVVNVFSGSSPGAAAFGQARLALNTYCPSDNLRT
jgi:L-arabinokinase